MRLASMSLTLAALLQVAAIAILGGASLLPLLVGAGLASFGAALIRSGSRAGAWLSFVVTLVLIVGAAGFAGGAVGIASLVFWTLLAATSLAGILLFGSLWQSPRAA